MNIPILTNWLEKRSLRKWDEFLDHLISGGQAITGVNVTEKTALNATAVFACVRILSETLASLPLPVYSRLDGGGKKRAPEHRLYNILHDAPNPYMTSFVFRETLMGHLVTWGNAYANIKRDGRGQVVGLWPLRPDRMEEIKWENGKLKYYYRLQDGSISVINSSAVLHIAGLGFDGLVGYSPIRQAADAVGLSLATEEYGSRFFRNGAKPAGVLRHPGRLKEDARENLRKSWNEMHQGLQNQHRIAILEEGMEYTQIGLPPEDSQFLQTRKFQLLEIARMYRIPPHMLADLERATFSNIEHQSIDFVVHTIRPWLVRWEQAIKQKLFLPEERGKYFAEFLVDGLLRGDTQSRYDAYQKGFQVGGFSVNEILELENRNPIGEAGDQRFVPMNMIPLDQAGRVPEVDEPEIDKPQDEPVEVENNSIEHRNIRAANTRSILAKRFEPIMRDAVARVVNGEASDIKRAVKKHFKERDSTGFMEWVEEYYDKLPDRIKKTMRPVFSTLTEMIHAEAVKEVGGEVTDQSEWVDGYSEIYAKGYVSRSRNQVKSLITEAQSEGLDMVDEISGRADEWVENRPDKEAMYETVNLANAAAKAAFAAYGVYRLKWVAIGSRTCPYCEELDGRVVGIDRPFVGANEALESEDGRMNIYKPTLNPPLHLGCVCQIVPE